MNESCRGFIGKIFGHSFKDIYDVDVEQFGVEEQAYILRTQNHYNFSIDQIRNGINIQPKRTTKVFKGSMCKRCGHFIENKIQL